MDELFDVEKHFSNKHAHVTLIKNIRTRRITTAEAISDEGDSLWDELKG